MTGSSLVAQWLGFQTLTAMNCHELGSTPGEEYPASHMVCS